MLRTDLHAPRISIHQAPPGARATSFGLPPAWRGLQGLTGLPSLPTLRQGHACEQWALRAPPRARCELLGARGQPGGTRPPDTAGYSAIVLCTPRAAHLVALADQESRLLMLLFLGAG